MAFKRATVQTTRAPPPGRAEYAINGRSSKAAAIANTRLSDEWLPGGSARQLRSAVLAFSLRPQFQCEIQICLEITR